MRNLIRKTSMIATVLLLVLLAVCTLAGCTSSSKPSGETPTEPSTEQSAGISSESQTDRDDPTSTAGSSASISHVSANFDRDSIAPYSGKPSVQVNGNIPYFSEEDLSLEPFESYSSLDTLGRCGVAYALVGLETMPTEKRGSIGNVKPSGWQLAKYDWVDGGYLFNRCHLIAFSLAGENDNPQNLITGTRSMNVSGMLPYEERVASYIEGTDNHVLYRVTPVFVGDELVARGVLMEAESVEDRGAGIRFCAWCYNVEPGVAIDYATGDNRAGNPQDELEVDGGESAGEGEDANGEAVSEASIDSEVTTYVLNVNTHRFHYPDCPSVDDMKEKNKRQFEGTREEAIAAGYKPCGVCKP